MTPTTQPAAQKPQVTEGMVEAALVAWCEAAGRPISDRHHHNPMRSALEAALRAQGDTSDGWLPIESAPRDGTEIILHAPERVFKDVTAPERVSSGFWYAPNGEQVGDCGGDCRCPEYAEAPEPRWSSLDGGFTSECPPTHWRPLPASPRAQAEGEVSGD